MWKIIGARKYSKIGSFDMDAKEKEREEWCGPERQRHSKAAHGWKNWKAQQKRGVVERRSGKPSKC